MILFSIRFKLYRFVQKSGILFLTKFRQFYKIVLHRICNTRKHDVLKHFSLLKISRFTVKRCVKWCQFSQNKLMSAANDSLLFLLRYMAGSRSQFPSCSANNPDPRKVRVCSSLAAADFNDPVQVTNSGSSLERLSSESRTGVVRRSSDFVPRILETLTMNESHLIFQKVSWEYLKSFSDIDVIIDAIWFFCVTSLL